jgi:hypothetical protein
MDLGCNKDCDDDLVTCCCLDDLVPIVVHSSRCSSYEFLAAQGDGAATEELPFCLDRVSLNHLGFLLPRMWTSGMFFLWQQEHAVELPTPDCLFK